MSAPAPQSANMAGPLLLRAAAYFVFWVVLAGTGTKDLAVGLVTAIIAAWLSLALLPPGELMLRPGRALALFLRFLWQSMVAGVSVAAIALSPVMRLKPGLVRYRTSIAPGNRRFLFMTYASLLPGTLPLRTDDDGLIEIHALDCDQPVAAQLAEEEARFSAAIAEGPRS